MVCLIAEVHSLTEPLDRRVGTGATYRCTLQSPYSTITVHGMMSQAASAVSPTSTSSWRIIPISRYVEDDLVVASSPDSGLWSGRWPASKVFRLTPGRSRPSHWKLRRGSNISFPIIMQWFLSYLFFLAYPLKNLAAPLSARVLTAGWSASCTGTDSCRRRRPTCPNIEIIIAVYHRAS